MNKQNSNIAWADSLRFIATLFVIMIHVIFPVVEKYNYISIFYWQTANIIESLCRSAVPLFVMLSGSLLLGKKETLTTFYSKRIKKIGLPFLYWSLVYLCLAYMSAYIYGTSTENIMSWVLRSFKNGSGYHLWYIYMILGIYLIIPYLSKMIPNLKLNDYYIFFGIWFLSLFLNYPMIKEYFPNFDLTFFTGYIGYLLLGFFLSEIALVNISLGFGIVLFSLGWLSTALSTWFFSAGEQQFVPVFYNYLSPNVAILSVGMFIIINKSNRRPILYDKIAKIISTYSYGMYLNHILILTALYKIVGVNWNTINPFLGVMVTFSLVVLLSITFVFLSEKLRLRRFLG
jgi:surface polysaccharide O-acyltransferase-like enzyme